MDLLIAVTIVIIIMFRFSDKALSSHKWIFSPQRSLCFGHLLPFNNVNCIMKMLCSQSYDTCRTINVHTVFVKRLWQIKWRKLLNNRTPMYLSCNWLLVLYLVLVDTNHSFSCYLLLMSNTLCKKNFRCQYHLKPVPFFRVYYLKTLILVVAVVK